MESGDGVSENATGVYYIEDFDEDLWKNLVPKLDEEIEKRKAIRNPGSVTLHITSPGGYTYVLYDILARVEILKAIGVTVRTVVTSSAFSCGAMLFIAGTPGHRYLGPYARLLLHYGGAGTGWVETPTQLERSAETVQNHFDTIVGIIKRYAKVPRLMDKIKDDNFYIYPADAIEWGLADKMLYK